MSYLSVSTPTLLLNTQVCRRNINWLVEKCRRLGTGLNPHFKTHQSAEIGRWFYEAGVRRITVSSLAMAEYFADDGWDDITLAFPANVREMPRINRLAGRVRLTLDVISAETARYLARHLGHPVEVLIEVDAGYGRTGIPVQDTKRIGELLNAIAKAPNLNLYGFYIHAGHTYDVHGREAVARIHQQSMDALGHLQAQYGDDHPEMQLSLGDTPSCSIMENFSGISEIRPGNAVFYDVMQAEIGSCAYEDIAVALAAPVVAKEPARHEVVVHGGGIHLAKDHLETKAAGRIYGRVVELSEDGWGAPLNLAENYVRKLSQEHGIIRLSEEAYERTALGGLLGILPIHSCLSADCMGGYLTEHGSYIPMLNWRRQM